LTKPDELIENRFSLQQPWLNIFLIKYSNFERMPQRGLGTSLIVLKSKTKMSYPKFAVSRLRQIWIYIVPFLLVSPSLIWLAFDRRVWPWDQAWYGEISLNLFYTLTEAPASWLTEMRQAIGQKPPGVTWLGQFFVPIGYLLGSIEAGLLLSIVFTQSLTLLMTYQAIYQLSGAQRGLALTGCVIVAAAPLFVGMSHQYFTEPLQTLAVAWFILIMSYAPKMNRLLLAGQLLAATTVAMLAKTTSPLFCLGPGLVLVWYLFRPGADRTFTYGWRNKSTLATLAGSLLLGASTVVWFAQNYASALGHILTNVSRFHTEMYGLKDIFLNLLNYWIGAVQKSFFFPLILGFSLLIVIGGTVRYIKQRPPRLDHFTLSIAIALLQIYLVLIVYSFGDLRDPRYLLALLPYWALLICWGLFWLNKPVLNGLVFAAFLGQWVSVYGQAFALIPPQSSLTRWLYPISLDARPTMMLQAIINQTCTEADQNSYNIIGVDIRWFNANSASFYAAKNRRWTNFRCYYTSLGIAESDPERAWARILDLKPLHFITIDSAVYPIPSDAPTQSLNRVNEAILAKVRDSPLMRPLPSLPDAPGIFIFRSI